MSSAVKQGVHVIDKDTRSLISLRYKRMTKAIWRIKESSRESSGESSRESSKEYYSKKPTI